ncbi:MarR family winged helix-turn-helix transcriptional regulator [Allofranklinella schreckenbergeri]|uniref:MarR family winged helix-turn-helix transcriptional regulator n=1 Tax=Allofranklinella schreckenbergeri TaxID=1076744 RepID=UPI001EEDDD1E|nr:MarR family transcriptional regulator [Allofranklinella schreckenbergeri]
MRNQPIDQTRLQRFMGYRLTRIKLSVHKRFLQALADWELGPSEFSLLVLVDANPGIFQRQISQALDISPPNLVPLVERLVERGLIERRASAEDRRLQQLVLTPAGKRLQIRAEQAVECFERDLEQALSAAERQCLSVALDKLQARLGERAQDG